MMDHVLKHGGMEEEFLIDMTIVDGETDAQTKQFQECLRKREAIFRKEKAAGKKVQF